MTNKISVFFLFILISFSSFGQVDAEYRKSLKKMFAVAGTEDSYQAVVKQMFTLFKQQYPKVEADFWNEFEKEFSKTSLDDLTEMLVPVYYKYMTKDDLNELIKFYQTPTGKRFAKNTPLIMQESMQIGQQWGMIIGQNFDKMMREKGVKM